MFKILYRLQQLFFDEVINQNAPLTPSHSLSSSIDTFIESWFGSLHNEQNQSPRESGLNDNEIFKNNNDKLSLIDSMVTSQWHLR